MPADPPLTPVSVVLMVPPLISIEFIPDVPPVEHPAPILSPREPSAWTTGLPRILMQSNVDVAFESACLDPITAESLPVAGPSRPKL
jgi:hypothetical protein